MTSKTRFFPWPRLWGLVWGLALLAAPLCHLATPEVARAASDDCVTSGSQQATCIYTFTGAAQNWTVPAGVTQATFDLYGAQGGGGNGGWGGRVTATLAVTPGGIYQIRVGGRANPFNGRGASDVRDGSFTLNDRVLVAGAGGGIGAPNTPGGAGGYPSGGSGASGGVGGGGGGTQTSGGAGGFGTFGPGGSGSLGQGGTATGNNLSGGHGGGGYYGGGAGGSAIFEDGHGGGGGGGSSYASPAVTSVSYQNGVRTGDGLISITYLDPVAPSVTINQAAGQADPASSNPVLFSAQFSEPVTGFTSADVTLSGSANLSGATVTVSGGPSTYTISVAGLAGVGTVVASLAANVATDAAGNGNTAATSTDNSVTVNFDNTGPVITPDVVGTLGNNDWYTSNVTVNWSVVDAESAISSQSGCETQNVTSDTNGITFTCTATSLGGSSSKSVTIKRDATAPTITLANRTAANAVGWNNSAVTVNWTCSDALAGAVNVTVSQTLISEGANQSATGSCTDNAGNSASDTQSGINLDLTAPILTPVVTPNPVLLGGNATVTAGAADTLAGLAAQSCGALDTSSVGTKTVTCTASDNAGNSATANVAYQVIYAWAGFFQPVDNLPMVNTVNAGQAIPVKFSLGGDYGLNIFASGYPASQKVSCGSGGSSSDPIEETVTAGSSSLQYDPAIQTYTYVWKTDKAWAGTCRQLIVRLSDGTDHIALFQFNGKVRSAGEDGSEAQGDDVMARQIFLPLVNR